MHVNAASYKNHPSKIIFREHESSRKGEYLRRVLEVEHATFTPLIQNICNCTTQNLNSQFTFHWRNTKMIID